MNDKEELFAKLFNKHKPLVKDMDDEKLREHRQQLYEIAFEAKAFLSAADDEIRERKAKNPKREWLVTTDNTVLVSEAINGPKARKERMSKMDKLKQQLLSAGIDEETVKVMVASMEKKATDKNLKTITFNRPTAEITAVRIEKSPTEGREFDASNLKFGE